MEYKKKGFQICANLQDIIQNYVRFSAKTTTIHNGIYLYLLQATNLPLSLTEDKNRRSFRRAFSLQSFFFQQNRHISIPYRVSFFVPKISTSALIKMLAQGMLSAPILLVGFPVVVRTVSKEMVSNVQVGSVFVVHSTHYKLSRYARNQLP